jgi:photosystem II stability/assembly factor-like uncharacterized protein
MKLFLGMESELVLVNTDRPEDAIVVLPNTRIAALAVDPNSPERLYCGTYGQGLLRTVDAGNTWSRVGEGIIASSNVLSVAVSPNDPELVFAGTEPSALYWSGDGGATWSEATALQDVPSRRYWSFPPKPDTHHVRWITPFPNNADRLLVAIEAGALVQSTDRGAAWQDRVDGGPIDSHTVVIHADRPERVLSAAGDGFFVSEDGGQTWSKPEDGLPYRYCYGLAVDAGEPDLAVMSVAPSAGRGHGGRGQARSSIVRREGDGPWQTISNGLISAVPGQPERFVALNNRGVYVTEDGARSWRRMNVPWKDEYLDRRPPAIAVVADDL